MTPAQLPKGAAAMIAMLRLCLDQAAHTRRTKRREFNAEERAEWTWLYAAFDTGSVANHLAELDRDTSDYVNSLMAEASGLISVKETPQAEGPTLFDGAEDAA